MNMKKTLLLLALLVALINSQACDIAGCQTCSGSTCTLCDFGFGYVAALAGQAPYCRCRSEFFWDTLENRCIACEDKYQDCYLCDASKCTLCLRKADFAPGTDTCVQECESIFPGCSSCQDGICKQCDKERNMTLNSNKDGCDCMRSYVRKQPSDNFCVPCHYFTPGCDRCTPSVSQTPYIVTCDTCRSLTLMLPGTCACKQGSYFYPKSGYSFSSGCSSCTDIHRRCEVCSSSNVCTRCTVSGFYLSGNTCAPCTDSNCDECDPPNGDCTKCKDSYGLEGSGCSLCDKNIVGCASCANIATCVSCDAKKNYDPTPVSNACECMEGTYSAGSSCIFCRDTMLNCNECTSATLCTGCVDGYYFNSVSCSSCIVGCKECTDSISCTTCDDARNFQPLLSQCVCKPGYFLKETSCVACTDTLIGCEDCDDDKVCLSCKGTYLKLNSVDKKCYCNSTMYYDSATKDCAPCISVLPNCDECDNSTYCNQCATGYTEMHTFAPTESSCGQCSTLMVGCLVCATPTVCTECDSANNFIFSGSSCQCAPAYYLSSGVCTLCNTSTPQCTACTSSGCTSCEDDYVVAGSSCVRLCSIQLCIDCFNSTTCMFCVIHSTLNDDRTECNCNTGYFSDTTTCALCSTVLPNCAECDNALKCTACEDGFVVDLETDQCAAFESALKMASLLLVLVFAALSF